MRKNDPVVLVKEKLCTVPSVYILFWGVVLVVVVVMVAGGRGIKVGCRQRAIGVWNYLVCGYGSTEPSR